MTSSESEVYAIHNQIYLNLGTNLFYLCGISKIFKCRMCILILFKFRTEYETLNRYPYRKWSRDMYFQLQFSRSNGGSAAQSPQRQAGWMELYKVWVMLFPSEIFYLTRGCASHCSCHNGSHIELTWFHFFFFLVMLHFLNCNSHNASVHHSFSLVINLKYESVYIQGNFL